MGHLRNSAIKLRCKTLWLACPWHFMELGGFLLAAWVVGIILAYRTYFPLGQMEDLFFFISLGLCFIYGLYGFIRLPWRSYGYWLGAFALILLGIVLLSQVRTNQVILDYQAQSQNLLGKNRSFEGYLLESSRLSSDKEHRLYEVAVGKQKIQVWVDRGPFMPGGEAVRVWGDVSHLNLRTERGYSNYQAKAISDNLVGKIYKGHLEPLKTKEGHQSLSLQARLQAEVEKRIKANLPANLAPIAKTLLIGGNYDEIDQDTMKDFSFTGLIHILSVSGSHMALLSGLTYGLLKYIGLTRRKASYLVILVLLGYAGLVGFSPPVLRSLLMGIILAFGLIEGRLYQARQGLHITALLVLAYDPMQVFDLSFQLSFGATYGIILFFKPLYQLLQGLPLFFRGPIALTVAAQFLMTPIQLYYFHFVSLAGLLASILVAPLLDLTITLLVLALILSCCLPVGLMWTCLERLLEGALYINHFLATSPYAYIWVGIGPLWLSCFYYCLCRLAYYGWVEVHRPLRGKDFWPFLSLVSLVGLMAYQNHHPRGLGIHSIYLPGGMGAFVYGEDNQLLLLALDKKEGLSSYVTYRLQKALHMHGYEKPSLVRSNVLASYGQWQGPKGALNMLAAKGHSYGLSLSYGTHTYLFLHGQIGEKIIQYLDVKEPIFMVDSLATVRALETQNKWVQEGRIIYSPRPYERGQIDPDDLFIRILGFQVIDDIILKE